MSDAMRTVQTQPQGQQQHAAARFGCGPSSQHASEQGVHNSPLVVAQRQRVAALFGQSANNATVQRVLLPVDGAPNDVAIAVHLFHTLAANNPTVQQMRHDPTVRVYIAVERSDEGGDARTTAEWDDQNNCSFILISLEMNREEGAADIQATLLHEIILHGIPAYLRHQAANGLDPDYTDPEVDEELFEAEEAAEHADVVRWQEVITHGANYGQEVWVETCRDLVRHLGVGSPLGLQVCYLLQAYDPVFAALYLG